MPRRSAASQLVSQNASSLLPGKRPDAPDEFDAAEVKIWKGIVGTMPPDWFTPEMYPSLTALCYATRQLNRINTELRKIGPASSKFGNLSRIQASYSSLVLNASSKLKLTAQSRHNVNSARKATKEAVAARTKRNPWHGGGRNGSGEKAQDDRAE